MRSFTAAYGAGYRAGMAGNYAMVNPFPRRRVISWVLWENGYHQGMMVRANYQHAVYLERKIYGNPLYRAQ